MPEFFGNDTDKTDEEVAYLLALAVFDRVKAAEEAAAEKTAKAWDKLVKAEAAMYRAEGDDTVSQEEVILGVCNCGQCQRRRKGDELEVLEAELADGNLAEAFGFEALPSPAEEFDQAYEDVVDTINIKGDSIGRLFSGESQIPEPVELATLAVLDENGDEEEAVILLRRFAGDRDFFPVGAISQEAVEVLVEEGKL